jgi:acetolactate synthase-1/2/3 large subunit
LTGSELDVTSRDRTGGQVLVECLLAHDVPLITCVPGESFLAVLDALYDTGRRPGAPRLVVTRHEAAAANMAEAAGKLTGRAAVCLVTRGPGATHAGIGVHTAYQDGTPLVLVVGQVRREHLGRTAFQEMNYDEVFGSSAKSVVTVMSADRIPEHVARAVHVAHSGRPGPVVLVVPEDVLTESSAATVLRAPSFATPALAAPDARRLSEALATAQRPLLIAGGAGWSPRVGAQLISFCEANSIPVAAAFRWQDSVDNASTAYVGYLGLGCDPALRASLREADLVVAFGADLDDPTSGGFELDGHDNVVLVSPAAEELCRYLIPGAAVVGSLDSAVDVLTGTDVPERPERTRWLAALHDRYVTFRAPSPRDDLAVDLASVMRHVDEALPDDAVITNGAGNYTVWVQRYLGFGRGRTQLAPRNGAMGYALPAALAAAALAPERTVVAFDGDGCALMSGSEIATAVQYGLKLVIVVVNNSTLGTIRMHQERAYPGRPIGTSLVNPDFVAYARSFGIEACRVDRTADFPDTFARALAAGGPVLIELRTDPCQLTPELRIDPGEDADGIAGQGVAPSVAAPSLAHP